jgi:hypothetical protein
MPGTPTRDPVIEEIDALIATEVRVGDHVGDVRYATVAPQVASVTAARAERDEVAQPQHSRIARS